MKRLYFIFLVIGFAQLISAGEIIRSLPMDNLIDNDAKAFLSVAESKSTSGLSTVRLRIKAENLYEEDFYVYTVWLVDKDNGFHRNIGVIDTNKFGRGKFYFEDTNLNLRLYDEIFISQEREIPRDVLPGRHILSADFPVSKFSNITYESHLTGFFEVPKVNTKARGKGIFVLDTINNKLYYDISYKNLKGSEISATVNGYANKNENAKPMFNLPLGSSKKGFVNYLENQEDNIIKGLLYVNIRSSEYPNGEIRGQIDF